MSGEIPCTCEDESQNKSKTCFRCKTIVDNVPFNMIERWVTCKKHKIMAMCGLPDFICKECKDAGWYSTAGSGGPRQILNNKTGENIVF